MVGFVQNRLGGDELEDIGNFLVGAVALVAVPNFNGDSVVFGANGNAHDFVAVRRNERGAAQHHGQFNPGKVGVYFRHAETPRAARFVLGGLPRGLHAFSHDKVHAVDPAMVRNVLNHVPVLFHRGNVFELLVRLYRPIGLVQILLSVPQGPSICQTHFFFVRALLCIHTHSGLFKCLLGNLFKKSMVLIYILY